MWKSLRSIVFILVLFSTQLAYSIDTVPQKVDDKYADSIMYNAQTYYFSNSDSAIMLYSQAYNLYHDNENLEGQMECLTRLSKLYQDIGRLDTAIAIAYSAIEIGEYNSFDTLLAETYLRMGNHYFSIKKYTKSREFYDKTIKLNLPNTKQAALGAIGQICLKNGELDSANYYLTTTLTYFEKQDSSSSSNLNNRSAVNGSLGVIAFEQDNYKKGIAYLNESLRLSRKVQNYNNVLSALINISIAYDYLKQPEKSEINLNAAFVLADSLEYNHYKRNICKVYTEHYVELNMYKEAFHWTTRYHALHDSLDKVDYEMIIYEKELEYNNRIKDEEKRRVIAEEKQNQLLLWLTIIGSSMLFLFITVFLFRKLQTTSKERNLFETKNQQSEDRLIEAKERLAKLNMHLAKQNELIVNLRSGSSEEDNPEIDNPLQDLEQIKLLRNDDWTKYLEVFQLIFPVFFTKINKQFPNLSEGDKRQLIMVKLGYSRGKSAGILGVTEGAVKRGRQRLSKKMGLDDVTGLDAVIKEF